MKMTYSILDKGEIEVLDIFGDELTIVNSARVSFKKRKTVFDEDDRKLLRYLIRHQHTSPFRHVMFRFRIKAPEFVMRQWYKHVVGAEWTSCHPSQLHGWNEVSGRYVVMDEFYVPESWRKQSANKKQGCDGEIFEEDTQTDLNQLYTNTMNQIETCYQKLLDHGVANEMARCILPLTIYTEVMWTVSLQALLHFVSLRTSDTTQYELREYANVLYEILKTKFPETTTAWSQI
jgi:thymidylate synthase (FAD)